MIKTVLTISLVGLSLNATFKKEKTFEDFARAIHKTEASGRLGSILGDGGAALGPLQIHKGAWSDVAKTGQYKDCADYKYSTNILFLYLNRYAKEDLNNKNWENCSRKWNGGPNGNKKEATVKYWNKVKKNF